MNLRILTILAGCAALVWALTNWSSKLDSGGALAVTGATMGTTWLVKVADVGFTENPEQFQKQVQAQLDAFERRFSHYQPDSELSVFNRVPPKQETEVSKELYQALAMSYELSELTDGAYDPTVADLVNLWGFGPEPAPDILPTDAEVQAGIEATGYKHLELLPYNHLRKTRGLHLNLSAFAKGLAVDEIARWLEDQYGIRNYLVEIGGEIRTRGVGRNQPWAIAVQDPLGTFGEVYKVYHSPEAGVALATSGNYANFRRVEGRQYGHTIDPHSGRPVQTEVLSASVASESAGRADAIATALMTMSASEGLLWANKNNIAVLLLVDASGQGDLIEIQSDGWSLD